MVGTTMAKGRDHMNRQKAREGFKVPASCFKNSLY
jgi:hypothetical protein